jgi:hypothetical protein
MVKFLFFILSFLGWKAKEPVPLTLPPPARVRWEFGQDKSDAELAREVLNLLDREGRSYLYGKVAPSPRDVKRAWITLESIDLVIAGYVRACGTLAMSLPIYESGNVTEWFATLRQKAYQSVEEVITAIWHGAALKSWPLLDDVLVRDVAGRLGKLEPIVIRLDGPEAKREVHVRDRVRSKEHPEGRPVVARLFEYGKDGPLHILDRGGGCLSRETVTRSKWTVCAGWIATGPLGTGNKVLPTEVNGAAEVNMPRPIIKH